MKFYIVVATLALLAGGCCHTAWEYKHSYKMYSECTNPIHCKEQIIAPVEPEHIYFPRP